MWADRESEEHYVPDHLMNRGKARENGHSTMDTGYGHSLQSVSAEQLDSHHQLLQGEHGLLQGEHGLLQGHHLPSEQVVTAGTAVQCTLRTLQPVACVHYSRWPVYTTGGGLGSRPRVGAPGGIPGQ